jgi:hypothetical protein
MTPPPSNFQKQQNSVSTVTRIWTELLRKWHDSWLWSPPSLLYNSYQGAPSTGVKLLGREADCSPLPSVKVLHDWSQLHSPICLHDRYRDTFTFYWCILVALWMCTQQSQQFTCSVYSMDSANFTSKGGPVCTRKANRERWGTTAHSRWRWVVSPIPLSGKEHLVHTE